MVVSLRKNKKWVVEGGKGGCDSGVSCPAPYIHVHVYIHCIYFNCHQVHIEKVL